MIFKMESKELVKKLYELLEDNRHKQVFTVLKKEVADESNKRKGLSLLLRRYNEYNDNKVANTISVKKANLELSRITSVLSGFIESLKESDLGASIVLAHQEIVNKILVFTEENEIVNTREFFLQLNFVNVEVKEYSDSNYLLTDFDLIVFNNQDLKSCPKQAMLKELKEEEQKNILNRVSKMDSILKESVKSIIHFGGFLYWVNFNRNRVHAANSKFSLYARTKEVIEFINTYRV